MNEENKKAEVTENKNEVSKTEANKTRKFDKKRPRNNNNNRTSKPKSDLEDKVIEIRRVVLVKLMKCQMLLRKLHKLLVKI